MGRSPPMTTEDWLNITAAVAGASVGILIAILLNWIMSFVFKVSALKDRVKRLEDRVERHERSTESRFRQTEEQTRALARR